MIRWIKSLFCDHQWKIIGETLFDNAMDEYEKPILFNFEVVVQEQCCVKCGKTQIVETLRPK